MHPRGVESRARGRIHIWTEGNMMRAWPLSLLPLVLLLGQLNAAIYHVSQNHPAAADTNPGTAEQPFKTISAAVKLLKAGDTLWVHAGVYREQVEFKPQGEDWTRPVVVAAAPGEEVVIKGSDVVTGWQKHEGHVWKKTDWKVNSQLVMVNGENLQQIAGEMPKMLMEYWRGKVGEGLADMKPGSFFMDAKTKTLYLWLKDNGDPNAATVEVGVRPHLLWAEGRYFVIKGFKMTQTSTSHRVNWPGVIIKGEHVVFQDNEVTWCDFVGFGMDGSFIDVIGNKFNHCGNSGIGGNSRLGCRLIGNETSYNNWRRWSSGWHAGGVKLIPIERHLLIHRHKAFRNIASDGIWIDSYDSSNI
ncbi:MAG: DUF1565 domain-containing protein, partial [Planctomycetes bacterium]|nr:DUF1565 domain-containing protein [Planctomycetota bacterium]